MLVLDSSAKLAVGQWIADHQVCLRDLAVGGNFVYSLVIAVIFKALIEHIVWGEDFEVIKWWASHKGMGPFLWGKLATQDTK